MIIKRISQLTVVFLLLVSFSAIATGDNDGVWKDVKTLASRGFIENIQPFQKARILELDSRKMYLALQAMANNNLLHRFASVNSAQNISLPYPNGQMIEVELVREKLLTKSLLRFYPKIKTYRILPSDEITSGKLDMTSRGFHAMLQTRSGETIFIDPIDFKKNLYASYFKHDQVQRSKKKFSCGISRSELQERVFTTNSTSETKQNSLINYRIAIAATGEYTQKHGGTVEGALAAITTTLNRVNQIFEQDLGVHLTLVKNNHLLIYTDPEADPFSAENSNALLLQNQANLDSVIGSNNYDIGHLFSTNGGGLAAIAGACDKYRKGQAISGVTNPVSDSFNLDFVAHEIGHQLGATHTFNGVEGLCSGDTRTSETAFEPGSGSSIMSYAGYCGVDNLQSSTDAMFHIGSIKQIRSYSQTSAGSCGVRTRLNNSPPVVNAGKDYVIPARTPFELEGSAIDADSDSLVYAWEQVDTGKRSTVNEDTSDNSLFRVYMPTNNKARSFPALKTLLNHQSIRGETLPVTQRELNFSFVVQDGYNSAQSDQMIVSVENTNSRFSLNLPHSLYNRGDTHKIMWNVANTDKPPINCQSVNIYLSTDGGNSFLQELASNIPNTGEGWITIPVSSPLTRYGRFKIKCSDNIFFAISYRDFHVAPNGITGKVLSDQDKSEPNIIKPKVRSASVDNSVDNNIADSSSAKGGTLDWFVLLLVFVGRLGIKGRRNNKR